MKRFLRMMVIVGVHLITLPIRLPILVGILVYYAIRSYQQGYSVSKMVAVLLSAYLQGVSCDLELAKNGYDSAEKKLEQVMEGLN